MALPEFIALPELLLKQRAPSFPVATGDWENHCFGEFLLEAGHWREAFNSHPEARWALFTRDTWRFATALFGAWAAGKHVYVPGDDTLGTRLALEREVGGFAGDIESPSGLPRLRKPPRVSGQQAERWERLNGDRVILTVYTSGSTGEPVGVPKKLPQLATEVEALERAFGEKLGSSTILSTVSHQHIYGLLFRVLWPLAAGRLIETRQLFYPREVLAFARQVSPAALVTSPAHLKRLPDSVTTPPEPVSLTAVFSSGGPLEDSDAESSEHHFGVAPFDILGSSETGGIAWRQQKSGCRDWTPLPFVEIRIEDDGILCVRSPQAGGFGWLSTADRARILEGGRIELLGRMDRIVKVEEKRVSLAAIEQALVESGLVLEARVLALPAPRLELAAVVVPSAKGRGVIDRDGRQGLQRSLREAAARRIERVGLPRRFRIVAELPVDARGKVTQQSLVALFDDLTPGEAHGPRGTGEEYHLDVHRPMAPGGGGVSSERTE